VRGPDKPIALSSTRNRRNRWIAAECSRSATTLAGGAGAGAGAGA